MQKGRVTLAVWRVPQRWGGLEAWFLDFSSLYKVKEDTLRTW